MRQEGSFDERLGRVLSHLSPAERRVALHFRDNREEVLISPAAALAEQTGTSDATVIRTAKTLGFRGLAELRRALAGEFRDNPSPASRISATISQVGSEPAAALHMTLDIHQASLDRLRRDLTPAVFQAAVRLIADAPRVFVFGIGPSSAMADYFAIQLGRFGIDASALTDTGLLLADGLHRLRKDDLLIIFAYGRVYRELAVMLDHASECRTRCILVSDTLGAKLGSRVDLVLQVARGSAELLSMHTATLALIEALLVGVAAEHPGNTVANLETLNRLRSGLAERTMDLPAARPARRAGKSRAAP